MGNADIYVKKDEKILGDGWICHTQSDFILYELENFSCWKKIMELVSYHSSPKPVGD